MNTRTALENITNTVVNSLNSSLKQKLVNCEVINPHHEELEELYNIVDEICNFESEDGRELLKKLFDENPDKLLSMDFLAETADPLYAAGLILEEAKRIISG